MSFEGGCFFTLPQQIYPCINVMMVDTGISAPNVEEMDDGCVAIRIQDDVL